MASTPAKPFRVMSHCLIRALENPWTNTPLFPQVDTRHREILTLDPPLASTPSLMFRTNNKVHVYTHPSYKLSGLGF